MCMIICALAYIFDFSSIRSCSSMCVCYSNFDSKLLFLLQIEAEDLEFESIEHTITLASPNVPDVFPSK